MIEKIKNALKTTYANKGFNDAELERIAKATIAQYSLTESSTEEDIETAISGVEPMVSFFQSEADGWRKTNAKVSSELASLKAKKGGKPATQNTEGGEGELEDEGGEATTPPWAKKLFDRLDTIEGSVAQFGKEKVATSRREELNAILANLSEKQRKPYSRYKLEEMDDDEFSSLVADVKEEVADIEKDNAQQGLVYGAPPKGQGITPKGTASAKEVDDIVGDLGLN